MSILRVRRSAARAALFVTLAVACVSAYGQQPNAVPAPAAPNVISYWDTIGAATVNAKVDTATTPEEQRPTFQNDMATLHLAMYDAVSAIDGRFRPYAIKPAAPAKGASMDAAASAAAYGVLRALFPNRGAHYQAAYDSYVATIADGEAKRKGLVLGAEVAAGIVAKRANDGRSVAMATYVPGAAAGNFRGLTPISRSFPSIRPLAMTSISQFRPPPPPALDSATYAADVNEVKAVGGAASTVRTAEQFEMARFHTEPPPIYLTRNFGKFARTTSNVADASRLMAAIYTGYADAINACFDAKYFYQAWRPQSAIQLADTDNNPATIADPAWTPSVPTPNHPEYPAAHSCTAGALGEVLRHYYGTDQVSYTFDSKVTGTTRTYLTADALTDESKMARIYGGMHFRYSTMAGATLGQQAANWAMTHHFGKRD